METREAIYCRKSVRSFTGEISRDMLEEILKAAKAAPIGMGKYETMHLTVVEQPQLLQTIDAATARLFGHPELHPLYGAPVFIVVSVKPEGEMPNNTEYSNAAVMIQNMALAAVDAGIGCCHIWGGAVMALAADRELAAQLGLPQGFIPCCGIVLGKTDEVYSIREIPEDRVAVNYVK